MVLNYQGRVSVAGKAFDGKGYFTFAIFSETGEVLWASGAFPFQNSTKLPAGVIGLSVSNGLYSLRLGDTNAGMPALQGAALGRAAAPKLRIWFNDGVQGWQQAGEDVSLAGLLGATSDPRPPSLAGGASTESILRELREVRTLLERQRANLPTAPPKPAEPTIVTVPVGNSPVLGRADAPLVLVEFTDFQCPFCRRFNDAVLPELIKNYVEPGKLRIISRSLPLAFHPQAEPAALAALCAHQQQQYWPMRGMLFTDLPGLALTNFLSAAETLKLDVAAFRQCCEGKTLAGQVRRDQLDAQAVGITGTPSFVLGRQINDRVTGVLIVGAQTFLTFDAEVKKLLAAAK